MSALRRRRALLSVLPSSGPGASLDDLHRLLGVAPAWRKEWRRELDELVEAGVVLRSDDGGYSRLPDPNPHLSGPFEWWNDDDRVRSRRTKQ